MKVFVILLTFMALSCTVECTSKESDEEKEETSIEMTGTEDKDDTTKNEKEVSNPRKKGKGKKYNSKRGKPKKEKQGKYSNKAPETVTKFKEWMEEELSKKLSKLPFGARVSPASVKASVFKNLSAKKVLCALKKLVPKALTRNYKNIKGSGDADIFPASDQVDLGNLHSCAVVSSAGSLKGSHLGKSVDGKGTVMRFNGAPTKGHSEDVGSKTSVRVMNDILVHSSGKKPNGVHAEDFPDSRKATIIGWDVCRPRSPFHKCLVNTGKSVKKWMGQDSVGGYISWRKKNPNRTSYFLHPEWVRGLGDILDKLMPVRLAPHKVPSTGFIGLGLMMHYCSEVTLYHMIPVMRKGDGDCKYYTGKSGRKSTLSCSASQSHHREAEIAVIMRMNKASDEQTYGKGIAVIPGLRGISCQRSEKLV